MPTLAGAFARQVLKPSEVTPLDAFLLAEIRDGLGSPPLQSRDRLRSVVGEALVTHPGVDMISFTGSTRPGRRVAELAAQSVHEGAKLLAGCPEPPSGLDRGSGTFGPRCSRT